MLKTEQKPIEWITRLLDSDFKWLGHILLKGLRFAWRHRPRPIESNPKEATAYPIGPYATQRKRQVGDLLLWVPRRIDSLIIDDLTGRFGYSHITVDAGEVDLPTGKPVMIETTIGQVVERKFIDEYANRAYARIPLAKVGVDIETFITCIKSRLGEHYDSLEALTLGEIDDPTKQMCSSLVSECLPETVRHEIAKARRLRLLHRASVSVHSHSNATKTKVFISPNGFAQYYGAPKGQKLPERDFLVEPHPIETSVKNVVRNHGWKAGLALGTTLGMLLIGTLILIIQYNNSPSVRKPFILANSIRQNKKFSDGWR
jgi:hypothetical protein